MYFGEKEKNAVTLQHSAQTKHAYVGKRKEISITKKLSAIKKIALKLLHHRLCYRYTRSLLAGDTSKVWEDIEIRINPDPFFSSCKLSSMNKNVRSKNTLNTKSSLNWVLWI